MIDGTPEKQENYLKALLAFAESHRAEFVVWFVHRDYGALWEKIKGTAPEAFSAWRDCGLLDGTGNPRPAYKVWRPYFEMPLIKSQ